MKVPIRKFIPKPYYEDKSVTIYHGDCREIVPALGKFDLLLTDPPYGIGERMKGGTWGSSQKYETMRQWDVLPDDLFIDSLITHATHSIIWGGNYFSLPKSRCWLVWDKRNAVPTCAAAELAWTNMDTPVKRLSLGVGIHDLGHPTQKPLPLFIWCISKVDGFADEMAQTIFDPFAGSCTTGRAAKDLGRKCVCIEREEKYCEIGAKRMAQEVLEL